MPRRVGWDVCAFDGREKKKKRRTEWMNESCPEMGVYFFLSFSLSLIFFPLCPFASNERAYLSVLPSFFFFFFFTCCVRKREWRMQEKEKSRGIFYFYFFVSCSHLEANIFLIRVQWRMTPIFDSLLVKTKITTKKKNCLIRIIYLEFWACLVFDYSQLKRM